MKFKCKEINLNESQVTAKFSFVKNSENPNQDAMIMIAEPLNGDLFAFFVGNEYEFEITDLSRIMKEAK